MIVPLEQWHLQELPWGSRVADLQATNACLCTTKDLLKFSHRLP